MILYCSVQLRLRRRECEIILPFNFRAPLPLSVPGPGEWEGNILIFRSRRASATLFVNPLLSLQHGNTRTPENPLRGRSNKKSSLSGLFLGPCYPDYRNYPGFWKFLSGLRELP